MGTLIQSVARSLKILNALSRNPDGLTNREIAELVDLNISTTHHLVNTLEDGEYVLRLGNGTYCVGSAAGHLYSAYLRGPSLHKCLNDAVGELANATGETAYTCVWQNQAAVIDAIVEGSKAVRVGGLYVGFMGDTHLRASGKVLLAYQGTKEVESYIQRTDFNPRTKWSIRDGQALRAQLLEIVEQGYAIDDREYDDDVNCVSAPVFSADGKAIAALTVSIPAQRFKQNPHQLIDTVLRVADQTSRILGYEPSNHPIKGKGSRD